MKRKIVYISGAESFDIKDVKAAFEEVRNTLKLDSDTLLFGVPVEEFMDVADDVKTENTDSVIDTVVEPAIIPEPVIDTVVAPIAEKPKKTSRKKQTVTPEPIVSEDVSESVVETTEVAVPILSILSSNPDPEPQESIQEKDEVLDTIKEYKVSIKDKEQKEPVSDEFIDIDESDLELDDVADMVKDDMPVDETEKTLEELLETMTPLREDNQPEIKSTTPDVEFQSDSSDTTLESLASEFVETQDSLLPPKKTPQRSKIGKLKNILPFKKMKREDPGIMGDLFGWAGIAANDEDFTIPGFFTGVASKK